MSFGWPELLLALSAFALGFYAGSEFAWREQGVFIARVVKAIEAQVRLSAKEESR